jgi:hypothetical protein
VEPHHPNTGHPPAGADQASAQPESLAESLTYPLETLSLTELFQDCTITRVTVPTSTLADVATILSQTIYHLEDEPGLEAALIQVVNSITTGAPLTPQAATRIAPRFGDLSLRELTTLSTVGQKLSRTPALEFELLHPQATGCTVTIAPGPKPEAFHVTLDWRGAPPFQTDYAAQKRWEYVQDLLPSLTALAPSTVTVQRSTASPHRYILPDGLTFEVAPPNERYANILTDPSPSLRPDLIHWCGLRHRFEEDEERLELDERLTGLYRRLARLCPDVSLRQNFDDRAFTREDLARCGPVPFLKGSDKHLVGFVVENLILIATHRSTGDSLLEDLAALEQFATKASLSDLMPLSDRILALEHALPSPPFTAQLFAALELPAKEYFIAALSNFVAHANFAVDEDLQDGLLFALSAGIPTTVTLGREFLIEEKEPPVEPTEDSANAPWEVSRWEAEEDPENVELFRFARVGIAPADSTMTTPVASFVMPHRDTTAEALHSPFVIFGDVPSLELSVQPNQLGEVHLPERISRIFLNLLGYGTKDLPTLAAVDDPLCGERTLYLAEDTRLRFKL